MPERLRNLEGFLRDTPLFADLEGEDLQALASITRRREVSRGNILFYESDPGSSGKTS